MMLPGLIPPIVEDMGSWTKLPDASMMASPM
jgi:hypothetical protein